MYGGADFILNAAALAVLFDGFANISAPRFVN
jgi:hypothetical protein